MSIEYLILGFISMRPATGYEIKSEVEQKVGALVWGNISYGNLYPKLKELEEKQWIFSVEETGGRNKKVYDLTGEGWRQLEKWLAKTPDYPKSRDELLIKMMFWGISRPHDHETLIQHLRSREVRTRELLDICENFPEHYTWADEYGVLAFDYGEQVLKAELEWIQTTIEKLEQASLKPGIDKLNLAAEQNARKKIALKGE